MTLRCSFCDKERTDTNRLIAGANVYICEECIRSAYRQVSDALDLDGATSDTDSLDVPKHRDIKAKLDEYIINQEYAKKV